MLCPTSPHQSEQSRNQTLEKSKRRTIFRGSGSETTERGGGKGGDLTGNSDPTHGAFDLSVYYIPWYSYSLLAPWAI